MKPWVVTLSIVVGVLLGLGAVAYQRHVDKSTTLPAPTVQANDGNNPWDRRMVWYNTPSETQVLAGVKIGEDAGDIKRIAQEGPRVFLEDEDGGRAVVRTYHLDNGSLVLGEIVGLRSAWYTALVALYDNGEQDVLPVDVDLRHGRASLYPTVTSSAP